MLLIIPRAVISNLRPEGLPFSHRYTGPACLASGYPNHLRFTSVFIAKQNNTDFKVRIASILVLLKHTKRSV
jgi:hypothetical protein